MRRALAATGVVWLVTLSAACAQEAAARRAVVLFDLDFSKEGTWFATAGDSVRMFHTKTGHQWKEIRTPQATRHLKFSPVEERVFATGSDDGMVRLYRVGRKQPLREIRAHDGTAQRWYGNDVVFSPDGRLIAACAMQLVDGASGNGLVRVWNLETGKRVHSVATQAAGYRGLAFSPDGKLLAVGRNPKNGTRGTVEVFRTSDWELKETLVFEPGFSLSLLFSADSSSLIIAGGECEDRTENGCNPTGKLWFAQVGSGQPARMLRPAERHGYFRNVSLSHDGKWFATGTSLVRSGERSRFVQAEIQVRTADKGAIVWTAASGVGDASGARFSPDGKVAAFCVDDQIQILNAGTGKLVRHIKVEQSDE